MKRTLAFLFALCMVLTLCACNDNSTDSTTTSPSTGPIAPTGPLYDRSSYSASDADAIAARDMKAIFDCFAADPLVTCTLDEARNLFAEMVRATAAYLPDYDLSDL